MTEIHESRDLFLTSMAVVYMFAFASLFVQIPGLYGNNGIQPAKLTLKGAPESWADLWSQLSLLRFLPQFGLSDTETGMDVLCLAGVFLSFLAFLSKRLRSATVFFTLWLLYISLFHVGQTFLWFQWDTLLLEAGFITFIVAPFGWPFGSSNRHDGVTFWLVRWLLFRLMFASGVVKLTSNCPTWWGLTAMTYHYESQCIPTSPAWYFHQLPIWFHSLSTVVVYVTEIVLPFLFFSPIRSQRLFAFYTQVLLMLTIALTGNYNFFNLLTAVLCLSLVDDEWIRNWTKKNNKPDRKDEKVQNVPLSRTRTGCMMRLVLNVLVYGIIIFYTVKLFSIRCNISQFSVDTKIVFDAADLEWFLERAVPVTIWLGIASLGYQICAAFIKSLLTKSVLSRKVFSLAGCIIFAIIAVGMFCISLVPYTEIERTSHDRLPVTFKQWHHSTSHSIQLSHAYGLFRRMTGVGGRPEVIIEGSDSMDGPWEEYNFLYKPGNVARRLPFVAPHQPRLDWQMWFAALGSYQHNPWFLNLVYRLLTNQPEVLSLMDRGPFDNGAPKYIRAQLYHYHFTLFNQSQSSDWWTRDRVDQYLPIVWENETGLVNYLKQAKIYREPGEETFDRKTGLIASLMSLAHGIFTAADGLNLCAALLFTGLCYKFIKG